MFRLIGQIIIAAVVVWFLLSFFHPGFVANAGNALLNAVSNSAIAGTAEILPDDQGKNQSLQVNLQGLKPLLHYVVTLDQDRCGGIPLASYDFDQKKIGSDGSISTTFSLEQLKMALYQEKVWVNIHEGSANGKSVACGAVLINQAADTTQVPNTTPTTTTAAPASNDQNGFGWIWGLVDFPQTGVEPSKQHDSYHNYKYPRKY